MRTIDMGTYGPSYSDLVESFATIVIQEDDDDYQGDSRLLVTDETGRYGLLTFGWGSCSGCDALQAAEGDETEVYKLRDDLARSVHWEDNAADLVAYINAKDWSLDYASGGGQAWRDRVLAKLAEVTG